MRSSIFSPELERNLLDLKSTLVDEETTLKESINPLEELKGKKRELITRF